MVMATSHETLGTFFVRQLAFLASHGFDIHAVCSPGPGLALLEGVPGVTTHALPMERRPSPIHDLRSVLDLFRLIRRLRPDIVHAHTPKAGLLGMIAATAAGVRIRLRTIHGLPLLTRKGRLRRVLGQAERLACALSTRTYCVSPSVASVVREMRLCSARKLITLGDGSCAGINLEEFDPHRQSSEQGVRHDLAIPAGALVLCYVGRIALDKGIVVLAEAWKELGPLFPNLHLLLCGGYDPTDPVPSAVLDELRSDARVHMSGEWVTNMPAVYAATDICVLPTFREGLPQVALEAGAMEVPLLATRVPGVVNAVAHGKTGLLVPPRDAKALASSARLLIENAALRRRLGQAGRRFVAERFSETRVNNLLLSDYRTFIGRTQQAEPARTAVHGSAGV
jgi:glycosyltransferase involved in cell wall biosynthesis